MKLTKYSLILLLLAAVPLASGCGRPRENEPPIFASPQKAPSTPEVQQLREGAQGANLIIILLDAARADHFGFFGYARDTTPRADEMFAESTVFSQAYCTAPNTKPSVTSLFTAQFPDTHGAVGIHTPVPSDCAALPEVMRDQGYLTVAFSANPFLTNLFGFGRGFDEFHEVFADINLQPSQMGFVPAELLVSAFTDWLEDHSEDRFFAYLHFLQPHQPYTPPPPFADKFRGNGKDAESYRAAVREAAYDCNLAYADHAVAQVLDAVARLDLQERSVIVLVSDHGEAFKEHGHWAHDTTVYQEMIHVPLAFRLPSRCGVRPGIRSEVVSLADVMPTLIDVFGFPMPETMQGRSRAALLAGNEEASPSYTVTRSRGTDRTGGAQHPERVSYALTTPRYTLILSKQGQSVELYDRESDPGEKEDIAEDRPEIVAELRQQFEQWAATQSGRPVVLPGGKVYLSDPSGVELDEGTRRRLEALGYL